MALALADGTLMTSVPDWLGWVLPGPGWTGFGQFFVVAGLALTMNDPGHSQHCPALACSQQTLVLGSLEMALDCSAGPGLL